MSRIRFRSLACLALLGAAVWPGGVARAADPAPAADDGWSLVAPGFWRRHDAPLNAELFRFDLQRYRASVVVPGARQPLRASEARAQAGGNAVLAVNGGFFDTGWASLGLRIAHGKVLQKLRPRVDWGVLLLRDGGASIVHSREYLPDAAHTGAIQVGPRLVVGGQVTPLKPQSARRTAVAVDREERFLTVVATRARADATALAERLVSLGAWSALMLDGGPSTQLSFQSGGHAVEIAGGYAVPDLLVITARE